MSQKNITFEEMEKISEATKGKKSNKKDIQGVKTGDGKYNSKGIMQETYLIKGGAQLRFSEKGNIQVLGGKDKAEKSKVALKEFIEKSNLSPEEVVYYKSVVGLLDKYIEFRNKRNKTKDGQNDKDNNGKGAQGENIKENGNDEKNDQGEKKEGDSDKGKGSQDKKDDSAEKDKQDEEKEESGNYEKDEKGNENMSEVENVKKQIEEFSKRKDNLSGKEEYKRIEDEIRRAKLHIERYEEELANLNGGKYQYDLYGDRDENPPIDTRKMDHIENIKAERELKDTIEEAKKRLAGFEKEKEDLDKKYNSDEVKKEENNLRDERSKYFTQNKMRLESEIRKVKHEMEGILIQVSDFKYEYKEGTRIPTNGEQLRGLNENYESLKTKLGDFQEAIKLCDEQKEIIKKELEDSVKSINDILSRKDKTEEKSEDSENKGKAGKDTEGKEKDGENKGEDKDDKDSKGKDGENKGEDKDDKDSEGKDGDDKGEDKDDKDSKGKDGDDKGEDKEEDNKGKKGKNNKLIVDGRKEYENASFMNKVYLKRGAWALEHGLDEDEKLPLFQRMRLFLPSRKYKEQAIDQLTSGKIAVVDGKVVNHKEQPKKETKKEERDPFQKQGKTPTPEEKGAKGTQDKEQEKEEKTGEER